VGRIRKPGVIGPGEKYLFVPVMRGGDPVHPSLWHPSSGLNCNQLRRSQGKEKALEGRHGTQKYKDTKRRPVPFAERRGVAGIWLRRLRTEAVRPHRKGVVTVPNMDSARLLVGAFKQET
jgi:hypothetical protein